jgi:nucleoid DNA-binding protein
MVLTEAQIVEEISIRNGFTKKKSIETVETLLEIIKQTLRPERMS